MSADRDDLMSSTINNLQKLRQDLSQRRQDKALLHQANEKIQKLEDEHYKAVTRIAGLEKEIAERARSHDAVRAEKSILQSSLNIAKYFCC